MCHVIYIILDLLKVRFNCAKFHNYRICVRGRRIKWGKLSRFLKMEGLFLGHSLIIIK